MRRNRGTRWNFPEIFCPKCENLLLCNESFSADSLFRTCISCKRCKGPVGIFKCVECCEFQKEICKSCGLDNSGQLKINVKVQAKGCKDRNLMVMVMEWLRKPASKFIILLALIIISLACWKSLTKSQNDTDMGLIKRLRGHYPSQENETWSHVLSVLEKEIPSVKSITLLHGEDKTTANCLVSELVSLYTANYNIKLEEITFSTVGSEVKDYGFSLEHYHAVVEKFRVLVTDLTEVSGNTARIFHSLCDEESSNIKPSLFIFTLKYDKKTRNLRPITRAVTILREAWSNLPESELSPLLSRVIKNVVNIILERQVRC